MKSKKYTAGFVILGVCFAVALIMFFLNFDMDSLIKEKEEETTKELSIKPKKKQIYELNEIVTSGKFKWRVTSAEVIGDYDELDNYYKKRGYLKDYSDVDNVLASNSFREEIYFVKVKFEVSNSTEEARELNLAQLIFSDSAAQEELQGYYMVDGRCLSQSSENRVIELKEGKFPINAGETIEVEYVGEFSKYNGTGGDKVIEELCLNTYMAEIPSSTNMGSNQGEKIRLDITAEDLGYQAGTEGEDYEVQRDIVGMKLRQWTNLEMAEAQVQGYHGALMGIVASDESIKEEKYVFSNLHNEARTDETDNQILYRQWVNTQITNVQVADWSELPEDFVKRGMIEEMAKRYQEKYGYGTDKLKLLLVDLSIGMTEQGNGEEFYDWSKPCVSLYDRSYLFTRDAEGKRWVFGTADDWLVTSSSQGEAECGHKNVLYLDVNQKVTVQMVYILPPDIYEQQTALYYGVNGIIDDNITFPIAEINLD